MPVSPNLLVFDYIHEIRFIQTGSLAVASRKPVSDRLGRKIIPTNVGSLLYIAIAVPSKKGQILPCIRTAITTKFHSPPIILKFYFSICSPLLKLLPVITHNLDCVLSVCIIMVVSIQYLIIVYRYWSATYRWSHLYNWISRVFAFVGFLLIEGLRVVIRV